MHTSLILTDICRGTAHGETKGSNHSWLGVHVKSFIKTCWLFSSYVLVFLLLPPSSPPVCVCVCVCVCARTRNLRTLQSSNLASHYKAFRRKMSSWAKTCSDELKQAENDKLSLIRDKHIQWYLNQSNGGKQKKQKLISRDGQRERERERGRVERYEAANWKTKAQVNGQHVRGQKMWKFFEKDFFERR